MHFRALMLTACAALSFVALTRGVVAQQTAAPNPARQPAGQAVQAVEGQANKAQGNNYNVNVTRVIEKSTPEGKVVYDVAYSYEFKGRGAVYVKGLGTVPPKGKFNYLTSDQQLEFKESAEGPTLATVRLEETVRTMGGDSTDIPKESDFPQAFRSSTWSPPATFAESAVRIIQRYFPSGYSPRQAGQLNFYVTTYRSLQVPSPNLRSQIAVIVSQPYDAASDRFTYRVQFVARDRPKFSDTWRYGDDRDPQTITAAQQFVDKLIQELTPTGGQR